MDEREAALADSPAISGSLESQANLPSAAQAADLPLHGLAFWICWLALHSLWDAGVQELRQKRLHLRRASQEDCRGKKRRLPASAKHKGKQAKDKQASNSEIATQFSGNFNHSTSSVRKR